MKIQGIVAVIRRNDGTLLLQLRDDKDIHYPNRWCFPGGATEVGESSLDNLLREMKEEFNIVLQPQRCLLAITDFNDGLGVNHVYLCQLPENSKLELNEGADMKWLTLEEIKKIPLAFQQETIIPRIEAFMNIGTNIHHPSTVSGQD